MNGNDQTTNMLYAASVGHSGWFSRDLGESWQRANTHTGGVYNESRTWCLSVHPDRPGEVLAGTDDGVYRWMETEKRWNHVPSPMDGLHILKIAQSPFNPDFIIAGTRPAELYRSRDNGRSWERLTFANHIEAPFINTNRVTSVKYDPVHPEQIWVTIEIDGLWRSRDGGDNWERIGLDLPDQDLHNVEFADFEHERWILVATEVGLFRSRDDGGNFHKIDIPDLPYHYFRCLTRRPDQTGVMFLSIGDRPSGDDSMLLRTRDNGETWEAVDLPGNQNTTIWHISGNAADPMLLFAISIFGEVYRSTDGGETWDKPAKFLGEAREIVWAPVPNDMLGEQKKAWVTADEFLEKGEDAF
ncbi:BNR/Asp-box repeat-containing protein [Parasphingorhabdus marina DSM 22363]|uniref:BNR/Asp-box repeat-containing protein n=1 Tax=Parasphingorhabdus marina DSM 22363 TaxID=1123272 RepID=A0A1N6D3S1_9SPHN|nr:hypothetical protein [Parasphingorhabdus marina]SIN65442.1 BNR/Asp-box repeat-containing protein [Parasphingorhabdus marina DSM 22363]